MIGERSGPTIVCSQSAPFRSCALWVHSRNRRWRLCTTRLQIRPLDGCRACHHCPPTSATEIGFPIGRPLRVVSLCTLGAQMGPLLPCNLYWPSAGPGTHRIVKCRFSRSRLVQPVCTNSQVMGPAAPSLPINGSKEIGLLVAALLSLYLRPQYNKPLALVIGNWRLRGNSGRTAASVSRNG
jgi:hypothetical protein